MANARFGALAAAALGAAVSLACNEAPRSSPTDATASLLVYSGRNEALIGPMLERFEASSGIEVRARYAETAELAATLLEEGANTPAQVFISQDAAALGALSAAGMLRPLDHAVLARVPQRFRSPAHDWVGISGRARSIVYNSELVSPADLPRRLEDVGDPRYHGRFGVAPTNGSFQAHMAVYSAVNGAKALDDLLAAMVANNPGRYPKNSAIVQAVLAGEVEWGLVNHYYLWRALAEDPAGPGVNHFMTDGDASGFVNVAGAGPLSHDPAAGRLIAFLLSDEAQRYFAEETFEYPLAGGALAAVELRPLAELSTPEVDFSVVSAAFEPTLTAIGRSGLIQ